MRHRFELFDDTRLVFRAHVGDDLADARIGFQVLAENVDRVLRHHSIDVGENARFETPKAVLTEVLLRGRLVGVTAPSIDCHADMCYT